MAQVFAQINQTILRHFAGICGIIFAIIPKEVGIIKDAKLYFIVLPSRFVDAI